MPSSAPVFMNEICQEFITANPTTILDVGAGFGHYGVLFRNYADIFRGRLEKHEWKATIVGVEPFEKYVTDLHDYIYNEMILEDIRKVVDVLPSFDFCFAGDVIEHMEKEEALHVMKGLKNRCKRLVMQIPLGMDWKQGPVYGNQFEIHRSVWTERDFLWTDIKVKRFRNKELGLIIC